MAHHTEPSLGDRLLALLGRVESAGALDPLADRVAGATAGLSWPSDVKRLLAGNWFGHAIHPVLTDFADGAWMACSFLDLFGPRDAAPAAQRLAGFGLATAIPTALTGLVEWSDTEGSARRVGLLHLGTSMTAFSLYGFSYLARRRNKRAAGVLLGVLGGVVAIVDGYFGGHLTLALGVGVQRRR